MIVIHKTESKAVVNQSQFNHDGTRSVGTNEGQSEKKIFVTYREMSGLSTDVKPTDELMQNNSLFLELDTNTLYYYADGEWVPVGQSPSGGSDDGGGGHSDK